MRMEALAGDDAGFLPGRLQAAFGQVDLGIAVTTKTAFEFLCFDQFIKQFAGGVAEWRQGTRAEFHMAIGAGPAKCPEPLRKRGVWPRSHIQRAEWIEQGFEGLPDLARLVDWRMPGCDRSGVTVGCSFSDLIALHHGNPCPALGQKVGAADTNHAAAYDNRVAVP